MSEPKVLVASTVAAHCCDGMTEFRWLTHVDAWLDRGYDFFLAMQTGQGHDSKLSFLKGEMALNDEAINSDRDRLTVWNFSVDQGEPVVSSSNRYASICAGRNLAHEFAAARDYTNLCFIDTDVMPTEDGIERLLQVDHPLVGAHVPAYCHDGPRALTAMTNATGRWEVWWDATDIVHPASKEVTRVPEGFIPSKRYMPWPELADVRVHWTTAGALLMNRECFRAVRWRSDTEAGLSDDPATIETATRLGYGPELVRHDVVWDHEPLVALEHRGRDLTVRR